MIYADNAATTRLDADAFEVMRPFLLEEFGNASQPYAFARKPKKALQEARKAIASSIGASPSEIFFTSGGTESDNWAIHGVAALNYEKRATITSSFEHHAVLRACETIERQGFPVTFLQPSLDGYIMPDALSKVVSDRTHFVSMLQNSAWICFLLQPINSTVQRGSAFCMCVRAQKLLHTLQEAVRSGACVPEQKM